MITKSQAKRKQDIKTKLMAAIAMLLVSSIMMVSSTYAWFTLSTAPEVTGITTAVGANGNLEMALLPKTGDLSEIGSAAGDSMLATEAKNVTWGNLVDLSDKTVYGLDKITLYPSALNAATSDANGNPLTLADAMLQTPTYGADGRVSALVANTFTGYYNSGAGNFSPDDQFGVRAVGTASGMTDRQLSYRNANSAANTATAQARNQASQSLNANGSALANIAIEYGMNNTSAQFDKADVEALRSIIDDLKGTDGVFDRIETAYIQYILAYAASAASGTEDTVWQAVSGEVSREGATLETITTMLTDKGGSLPDGFQNALNGYNAMVTSVNTADTKLQGLEETLKTTPDATFTWEQIREAMTPLANPAAIKINGFLASEVKQNLGALVSSVTEQGGLTVIMESGAGVYAGIADQAGDYTASITIESVEYNGIVLNNMKARMKTQTTVNPQYLPAIGIKVADAKAPASGAAGSMPITDMYGYVIDLAFRTNAAESDLLLQVDAADRIYDGNTNEDTMGGGSSMTFKATATDFTDDQVKALMSAIRIVFFNPDTKDVVATAKLDVANASSGADGITAKMYLYTVSGGGATSYQQKDYDSSATGVTYYTKETKTVYNEVTEPALFSGQLYILEGTEYKEANYNSESPAEKYYEKKTQDDYTAVDATTAEGAAAGTLYIQVTTTAGENKSDDNAIMPLTQNQAHALSVLVYLDGNNVGNDDVAATQTTSMTGSMNLQFASSANLVPMDYAALKIPAQGSGNTTGGTDAGTGTGTGTGGQG